MAIEQAPCPCAKLIEQHTFRCVEDAVHDPNDMEQLRASCDEIATDESKNLSIARCRHCATHWAQGCTTTGPMDIYHMFPVYDPDPKRWLTERTDALPLRRWLDHS